MPRPNILFIMADDMGYGDVDCYNPQSKIPTPNMDRLAREGVRFSDAHSPAAVCTPTRYGALTRRYCWRSLLKRSVLFGYFEHRCSPLSIQYTVAAGATPGGTWHTDPDVSGGRTVGEGCHLVESSVSVYARAVEIAGLE